MGKIHSFTDRVVFFGSSEYCLPVLETINNNFQLQAVITRPKTLPAQLASSHNIKTFTPANQSELLALKDKITVLNIDLAVVADYGLIIPKEIFTLPRYKTLNIHFSKLPKLRGPSPVQYAILAGEKNACISLIIMNEGIDSGDIIFQKEIKLAGNETSGVLYKKLFNIIAVELPTVISLFVQNKLHPIKQNHKQATYTKLFSRQDGFIPREIIIAAIKGSTRHPGDDQNGISEKVKSAINKWPLSRMFDTKYLPARQAGLILNTSIIIERTIRALTPWPGVWTQVPISAKNTSQVARRDSREGEGTRNKKRLKILKAHLEPATCNLQPATKLILDQVQLEGKNPVSWKQFTEGYPNWSF